jgi:hypothetical protein
MGGAGGVAFLVFLWGVEGERVGGREGGREGTIRYEGGMDERPERRRETWRGVGAFAQAQGKGCYGARP